MTTEVPISPEVLQWAREFRRLSVEDAAERLGIEPDRLKSLEDGEEHPSLTLFETIAAKYRLPQSTLFRRKRPKDPPAPRDFRTFGGGGHIDTFELSVAISNVRSMMAQLQRVLEDDAEYRPPSLPMYKLAADAAECGERERARLGVSFADQDHWKTPADAFRQWRRVIEAQGVSVFLQKFPLETCRGFSVYEGEKAPSIVVNKSEEYDVARIFTLAHEYAHLLLRQPGISDENPRNPVEAYCNRFAAGFLMPKSTLRQLLPYWPNEPIEWSDYQISEWAKRLKVSRQALAIRLEELGVAAAGFSRRFVSTGQALKRSASRGNAVSTRISEVGYHFAGTVLSAFDRGVITKAAAVDTLGLAARHFGRVREALSGRRSVTDAGIQ